VVLELLNNMMEQFIMVLAITSILCASQFHLQQSRTTSGVVEMEILLS
jgi:hypothetical protein